MQRLSVNKATWFGVTGAAVVSGFLSVFSLFMVFQAILLLWVISTLLTVSIHRSLRATDREAMSSLPSSIACSSVVCLDIVLVNGLAGDG